LGKRHAIFEKNNQNKGMKSYEQIVNNRRQPIFAGF
jgi:hypothetical protein